ncbi:ORF24 [White sturgeon adenovirus 1]|uniref:ORF24 n=1 Tax=White sturgeon adenovirus 1 TaxID=2580388 RepID=A0A4P8PND3_9ADEN|nr:ORF24 [White sturgeon adenovirus 1]QCQ84170.1 ORF24 [White sturgeon adenovirus 1]
MKAVFLVWSFIALSSGINLLLSNINIDEVSEDEYYNSMQECGSCGSTYIQYSEGGKRMFTNPNSELTRYGGSCKNDCAKNGGAWLWCKIHNTDNEWDYCALSNVGGEHGGPFGQEFYNSDLVGSWCETKPYLDLGHEESVICRFFKSISKQIGETCPVQCRNEGWACVEMQVKKVISQ